MHSLRQPWSSLGPALCAVAFSLSLRGDDLFEREIAPILQQHCIDCHSTKEKSGELDLERFASLELVRQDIEVWQNVLEQLILGEMPPEDAAPLSKEHKTQLQSWVRKTLDEAALASAGDPGPVVLRRLSNHEYTYTIRDLTGIESLDPAREFPVDGAAGEGFTNVGAALVMSPALLTKYIDAAKAVSKHAVLLPNGARFSPSDSIQDWTTESLEQIRAFYGRYTVPAEVVREVEGTGQVKNEGGVMPLDRYLDALQHGGSKQGLSSKYLSILETALNSNEPSPLMEPLRAKYKVKQLTAADIEPWRNALWKFSAVGHIGRAGGPKAWQEPVSPLTDRQELRIKLDGGGEQAIYLIANTAGDGDSGDEVVWEQPRLTAPNRPDIPVAGLQQLVRHLEAERKRILDSCEDSLQTIGNNKSGVHVDSELLTLWRDYLGLASTRLEPLLTDRLERTPEYDFIQGWKGGDDLSVLANRSDVSVRIPGVMPPHSIAVHPAPNRAAVIAWVSPDKAAYRIAGDIVHAHPVCGNGVAWRLEVRRGRSIEVLSSGFAEGSELRSFGPFENVNIEAGQVVAMVIDPRDGDHSCDLTTVNLTVQHGEETWDLAKNASPDILRGNPQGPWHFLSQNAGALEASDLPAPLVEWRKSPGPELAKKVREHLERDFPLTHPLLKGAITSFKATPSADLLTVRAPSVLEIPIPAALTQDAEFVVTGKLADESFGSVQLQAVKERPDAFSKSADPSLPIVVNKQKEGEHRFESYFDEFRSLFPAALCYTRIVPVDEVVTLTLFHREDEFLKRLMLTDDENRELNRLWEELLFVSEAPLKQLDAFIQLEQYATQDRHELLEEFEVLRPKFKQAVETFEQNMLDFVPGQQRAVLEYAERAWRRPLTEQEKFDLLQFGPRLMLVRVLASPDFLYKSEQTPERTGPVNDLELASRLSYFLWSSAPDDELRAIASSGQLREPAVLLRQTGRMLKDPKIRRLALEFGCQWLQVRDVSTLAEKSERHFPTFVDVRDDLQEEAVRFFIDLFQNNRSPMALIDSDYTFVNSVLAEHYGYEPTGPDWKRIEGVRGKGRGGALAFGATLAKHSGASRTSAILRGTWVSEVVLGDKLPNPPKGVPVLPEESPDNLTERQLIERHSSDPKCAGCHRRIDPYGFALEGFDAIGRSRSADTKTVLHDGQPIDGLQGLKDYIVTKRKEDFLRQFCRKLLGYALGRSAQLSDQPLIDQMIQQEGVGDMAAMIVASPQFQNIRGREGFASHTP